METKVGLSVFSRNDYRKISKTAKNVTQDEKCLRILKLRVPPIEKKPVVEAYLLEENGYKNFYFKCGDSDENTYYRYIIENTAPVGTAEQLREEKHLSFSEYVKLPFLPTEQSLTIARIELAMSGKYDRLVKLDSKTYSFGDNPKVDFVKGDIVTPVSITDSEGHVYRVDEFLWVHLNVIYKRILEIEKRLTKKHRLVYPFEVFIDPLREEDNVKYCSWVNKIAFYVGS